MARSVHVLPLDEPIGYHVPAAKCGCSPLPTFRDVHTGSAVYRHRVPPRPSARDVIPGPGADRPAIGPRMTTEAGCESATCSALSGRQHTRRKERST